MALDWDLLNEDCADISDWADQDTGSCVSSQATFDSKSCFKFYCPVEGILNEAQRYSNISLPATFTFEMSIYLNQTYKDFDIQLVTDMASPRDAYYLYIEEARCWIGGQTVYYPRINNSWQTFRYVVKSTRKVDLWIDDRIYVGDKAITQTSTNAAGVYLYMNADNVHELTTYIDWVRVDTTPEGQTTESVYKIHDQAMAVRFEQTDASAVDHSKKRIRAKAFSNAALPTTCEVPIVATSDVNASKVRIYDGSAVKSLMKLPS